MVRLATIAGWITAPAKWFLRPIRRLLWRRNTAAFRKLLSRAGAAMATPMFVKIGANDGITGDPCGDLLIAQPSWRGLLIEPVPYCCDRLRQNFSDSHRFRVVEAAIATEEGTRELYFVDKDARTALPDLPLWYDQLGTFDPHHIEKHFGTRITPYIESRRVPVKTYSAVMADNNLGDYALLHVDTEGYDFEILKMVLACPPLPKMIFIEHAHLSRGDRKQMRSALKNHGYAVSNCGMDYFAVSRGWKP